MDSVAARRTEPHALAKLLGWGEAIAYITCVPLSFPAAQQWTRVGAHPSE
jgi:hypothetical protein